MKKLIIILLALIPVVSQAQNFQKYENMREVSAMVMTSNMFKLLAEIDVDSDDEEVKQYLKLIESLEDIKVISTHNSSIGKQMENDMNAYITKNALQELMRFKDENKNVRFYSKPGSKPSQVKQLVMLFNGQEDNKPITVALSITGNIDLKEISKLAKDLKVPGAEELENLDENN
ncbi:DUF4252 domain-containing protein [Mesonia maritima]|uniref:DUF4252 domain-containing protein n=1 Tax=Mesonia maritima TaxID=1793873 RepID=A0ABU1K557_9FLAO|nr:DUF4252 domain-containing protein [Mesonia maritima]MDR6300749.1 hypothetical protein [Mesonia maritima]